MSGALWMLLWAFWRFWWCASATGLMVHRHRGLQCPGWLAGGGQPRLLELSSRCRLVPDDPAGDPSTCRAGDGLLGVLRWQCQTTRAEAYQSSGGSTTAWLMACSCHAVVAVFNNQSTPAQHSACTASSRVVGGEVASGNTEFGDCHRDWLGRPSRTTLAC
ncbi:predicted protein [Verticillium alfalfae VaMs.102]|uniref:Predicted protein n=1 Tax=Verticillium alfalfae (strain VaMs.102 / ATCC MYA-4576 / FGSC 10136) TaxID=526221 RepID=C9S976_VERA1|nr:predicted protein [Verticillium alfalfae VaMs.102]EEY14124.1 predicted protein [Verticillium alfalfae VaMs.102]